MRRSSLGLVLIALNVTLAVVALAALAGAAASLLRRYTDAHALERVRIAAMSAERAIEGRGEMLATMARILAAQNPAAVDLARFRSESGVGGCAIVRNERTVASSGPPLDWPAVARASASQAWSFAAAEPGAFRLSAASPVIGAPGSSAVVVAVLESDFMSRAGEELGATVRITDAGAGIGDLGDPKLPLRARLLHDAAPEAKRLGELGVYATVRALKGADGRVAGFLETEIPDSPARNARYRLVRRLMILTVVIGGCAAIASAVIARRIAVPVRELSEAAERIGGGDLATPVESDGWAEIGRLQASMEEMRRRLKRLTEDLDEQRSDARAMVDGIVEGVYVVNSSRRIVQMNRQAAVLLGVSTVGAVGRFCGDVLNPEPVGGVRPCEENCPILHARFRGEARATERLVLPDGRKRTVVVTSSVSGGDRQFQLLRDETEVEAARRLRDAVLAHISHEFKTPLAAQLASLELLVDRVSELHPDETRKLVISLQRGALRLTQLIDNLLESVRIEAGRAAIRRQSVHLDEVVEEAVEMLRPLADQRSQTIEVSLPHPLPSVPGDGPRLVQVFVNLLANAGKFAPEKSTVRIGGEVGPSHVTLFVEDEGLGWGDEVEPELFTPFVRGIGDEPESSGVGLGLYIAKSIVERHGGSIDARSGSGRTRVVVRLPIGPTA